MCIIKWPFPRTMKNTTLKMTIFVAFFFFISQKRNIYFVKEFIARNRGHFAPVINCQRNLIFKMTNKNDRSRADKGWAVKRARPSKQVWCSGLGLCLEMSLVFDFGQGLRCGLSIRHCRCHWIGHFPVTDGSEAEDELVLIQTFLLYYVNQVILMLTSIFQEQFP